MINTKILDIKQLTARIKQADPSISIEEFHVEGNVSGNIVVGNGNVIGDHNVIYKINTLFGAFINLHPPQPSISRRPPGQPPHPPLRFVGRERELNVLAEHIRNKQPVLLYGHGGMGKTTLLQKVANGEAAKSTPDGVVYLEPLYEGNISSFQDVIQRLFDRMFESNPRIKLTQSLHEADLIPTSPLGNALARLFPKSFGAKPAASFDNSLIEANLAGTNPLIILDEMGIQQEDLNRLHRLFPTGTVLATSQNAPFDDVYESIRVTSLSREEAIELFAEKSDIVADAKTRPVMEEVCGILEDIPLAIATIATGIRQNRIQLDSLEGIQLISLVHMLKKIQPLSQDPAQAAIERSFKLLYVQLRPEERELLVAVATAPGRSIDRKWLEQESPSAEEAVRDLEGLEVLKANSPRMRLPDGLRAFLQSSLAEPGMFPPDWDLLPVELRLKAPLLDIDPEGWRAGLLDRLAHELEQHSLDFDFLSGELGNILGLLRWAVDQKRWPDVIRLGKAIDPYLTLNGLWDAWATVLKQVAAAARNAQDPKARSWALHQLGTREIGVGTRERAIDLLKRALELRVRNGEIIAAVYTLHNLRFLLPPGSDGHENGKNGSDKPKPPTLVDTPRTYPWTEPGPFLKTYGDILLATLVGAALIGAVLLLPSLRLRLTADPARYGPAGQVIMYSYRVDNPGFRQLPGPILVSTREQAKMRCPDLVDIGNHDNVLDPKEEFICTSSYSIARADVEKGSVTNTATAWAGDSGVQARSSLTIRRDDRYVMLDIAADPSRYEEVGQQITVSFHVSNPGPATASGMVNLISEKQLRATCPGAQQVSQGSVVLEAGESLACTATFSITDADVKAGSWTDKTSVSVGDFNSDEETITIPGPSALSLSKSAAPKTYQQAGQEIQYTYVITNRRKVELLGDVTVADDNVPVDCPAQDGRLDPDERLTCTRTYIITPADVEAGALTNTAIAGIGSIQSDPVTLTIFRSIFDLDLVKTADPPAYQAVGQDITYSYEVSNLSKDPVKGPVTITDSLLVAPCPGLNTVGNRDEFLDPPEKLNCSGTYRISQENVDRHSVTNRAFASTPEHRSAWQWLTISLEIPEPEPVLSKSAVPTEYKEAGQEITYTYKVTNPGPAPLFGKVFIYDEKVHADCSQVIQVAQPAEVLAPGESVTCTGTYVITEADVQNKSVTNFAWAAVGNSISKPSSFTIYYDEPDGTKILVLSKSARSNTYEAAGQRIIYLYNLRNDGPSPLKGRLTVEDNRVRVDCPVQEVLLEPDDSLNCTGIYHITPTDMESGSVTNTAWAHVGDVPSNRDTETIYARGLELMTVAAEIESTGSADPGNYEGANQVIRYSYKVTSKNRLPLPGPVMVTAIDDRTGDPVPVDCPRLSTIGNKDDFLDWHETITCTGSYTIVQDDIDTIPPGSDRGSVTNTAVASAGGVSSKPFSLTIQGPKPLPELSLTKMANPTTYDEVDQKITYTYIITNGGNVTLSPPFKIADDRIDEKKAFDCEATIPRLAPDKSVTCSRDYIIAQADFNFGNSFVTNNASASAQYRGKTITSPTVTTTITCPPPPQAWIPYIIRNGEEELSTISAWYPETGKTDLQKFNCVGALEKFPLNQRVYLPHPPPTAIVYGDVRDTGGALVNIYVKLINIETGMSSTILTNGRYTFSDLEPGTYEIFQFRFSLSRGERKLLDFTLRPETTQPIP